MSSSVVRSDLTTLQACAGSAADAHAPLHILLSRLRNEEHRASALADSEVMGGLAAIVLSGYYKRRGPDSDRDEKSPPKAAVAVQTGACMALQLLLLGDAGARDPAWLLYWEHYLRSRSASSCSVLEHDSKRRRRHASGSGSGLEWHGAVGRGSLAGLDATLSARVLACCWDLVETHMAFFARERRSALKSNSLLHALTLALMLLPPASSASSVRLLGELMVVVSSPTCSMDAFARAHVLMTLLEAGITVLPGDIGLREVTGVRALASAAAEECALASKEHEATRHKSTSWKEGGLLLASAALSVYVYHVGVLAAPKFLLDKSQRAHSACILDPRASDRNAARWCWQVWRVLLRHTECIGSGALQGLEGGLKHVLSYYHLQSHTTLRAMLVLLPDGENQKGREREYERGSENEDEQVAPSMEAFVLLTLKRFLMLRVGAAWKEHAATTAVVRQCWRTVHALTCAAPHSICVDDLGAAEQQRHTRATLFADVFAAYYARPEYVLGLKPAVAAAEHLCPELQHMVVRVYASFVACVGEGALWDGMDADVGSLHAGVWGDMREASSGRQAVVADQNVLRSVTGDIAELVVLCGPGPREKLQSLCKYLEGVLGTATSHNSSFSSAPLHADVSALTMSLSAPRSPSAVRVKEGKKHFSSSLLSPHLSRRRQNMKVVSRVLSPGTPIKPRRPQTRPQTGRARRPPLPASQNRLKSSHEA